MSQVGDQSLGCHKNFDFLSQVGDQSSGCRKNFDFFVKYVYIFMILAISMIISTCPAMGGALGAWSLPQCPQIRTLVIYIDVCIRIYIYICMHIYIYICIYMYIPLVFFECV